MNNNQANNASIQDAVGPGPLEQQFFDVKDMKLETHIKRMLQKNSFGFIGSYSQYLARVK